MDFPPTSPFCLCLLHLQEIPPTLTDSILFRSEINEDLIEVPPTSKQISIPVQEKITFSKEMHSPYPGNSTRKQLTMENRTLIDGILWVSRLMGQSFFQKRLKAIYSDHLN
ncbi:hypothetical protein CEXT_31921 [Caerostris extrusa]|uniref:Uncharacterized protein n=1 Tax=Caerostris extrusa TaxID=172846 RepID=A0AAV4S0G7_CAEEX|nr:hypothetical protein CEXT_31921 [Caerostris extrusa]